MAVALKVIDVKDPDLRQVQQNVADAVEGLSAAKAPALGVLKISASQKLVGNEDVVLVDASAATAEISLILPAVKILQRRLTVKVTRAGSFPVTVKPVDIPSTSTPKIDGANSVSIPAGSTESLNIVSDGRAFSTV